MTVWTQRERDLWAPVERLPTAEWAERYRVLGEEESARPGPWDNDVSPFMVEPMNCLSDPTYRIVGMISGAQVGKSDIGRNWLGRNADVDPAPAMIVFPDTDSAKDTIAEKIEPMLRNTPRLSALMTGRAWDVKTKKIKLRASTIFTEWASSPQRIATRQIRDLVLDEVDKYDDNAKGKEGDAITLALLRLTTYEGESTAYICSTPTNRYGAIWRGWKASPDRRRYYVPCPHCGEFQTLEWERINFVGKGSMNPEEWLAIKGEAELGLRDVHYVCVACEGRIDETHKAQMLLEGHWRSLGYPVGTHPPSTTVYFQISSLYSQFVSWGKIVAEHFDARLKGKRELHGWINGRLGTIAEDEEFKVEEGRIRELAAQGHPAHLVPAWATALISTADSQKAGFWWGTRAHGALGQSRLIDWGFAYDLEHLRDQTLDVVYEIEGLAGTGVGASPAVLLVDARGGLEVADQDENLTDMIYQFAATDVERIKPIVGYGGTYKAPAKLRQRQGGKDLPEGVEVWVICTQSYKDVLAGRINPREGEPQRWELSLAAIATPELEGGALAPTYQLQMASEEKVAVHKGAVTLLVWRKVSDGAPNHMWDVETYQCAGADLLEVSAMPTLVSLHQELRGREEDPRGEWDEDGGGWWTGSRREGW